MNHPSRDFEISQERTSFNEAIVEIDNLESHPFFPLLYGVDTLDPQ